MTPEGIYIRPVRARDVPLLKASLPQGGAVKHDIRWRRQRAGEVLYLLAWIEDTPVGHVLVKWGGSGDDRIARAVPDCPDLEDLLVQPRRRSQGIGSALLSAAEEAVKRRGHHLVGLGVGIDNGRARALYERAGYEPAPVAEFSVGGEFLDAEHRLVHWEERCIYLVKVFSEKLARENDAAPRERSSCKGDNPV